MQNPILDLRRWFWPVAATGVPKSSEEALVALPEARQKQVSKMAEAFADLPPREQLVLLRMLDEVVDRRAVLRSWDWVGRKPEAWVEVMGYFRTPDNAALLPRWLFIEPVHVLEAYAVRFEVQHKIWDTQHEPSVGPGAFRVTEQGALLYGHGLPPCTEVAYRITLRPGFDKREFIPKAKLECAVVWESAAG